MENRKIKRQTSNFAAEVYTRNGVFPADTENLSGDGVCLSLNTELPENEMVGVSMFYVDDGIENPDVEPINVSAKVIWCKSTNPSRIQAGLQFEDLPAVENPPQGTGAHAIDR